MCFEEKVTVLCAQALAAHDETEVRRLLAELRLVLHGRIEELRVGLLSAYSASVRRSKVVGVGPHLRERSDEAPGSIARTLDEARTSSRSWQQVVQEIVGEHDQRRALLLTEELNGLLKRHGERLEGENVA